MHRSLARNLQCPFWIRPCMMDSSVPSALKLSDQWAPSVTTLPTSPFLISVADRRLNAPSAWVAVAEQRIATPIHRLARDIGVGAGPAPAATSRGTTAIVCHSELAALSRTCSDVIIGLALPCCYFV